MPKTGIQTLAARLSLAAVAAVLTDCRPAPKQVVYDLAERAPVAERWSSRDVLLFGTPSAEPFLAEGFHREAGVGGEPFLWSKGESELALQLGSVTPRAFVLDLMPFRGVRDASMEVRLNGISLSHVRLSRIRSRYRIELPAQAQRTGENRLRFVFAETAAPAEVEAGNRDRRQLAAAFYSLMLGLATDTGLDDMLRREAPRPFGVTEAGAPELSLVGPALVRYSVRLPRAAELRFTPALTLAARAAGGAASFRVVLESGESRERELWSMVLRGNDAGPGEVRLALPGSPGEIVRLSLLVGPVDANGFAWGCWRAPRILGRGETEALATGGMPQAGTRSGGGASDPRANGLRGSLAGTNVVLVILDAARARSFGTYGYSRPTTPVIDSIAAEGVVFERAFTPAVYTLGAMSSVWTSQLPDRHHGGVSFWSPLPKDRLTLAELLSGEGVSTAGFVAGAVAGGLNGFDRGFQEFHEVWRELGSRADVFRQALPPWLAANRNRRSFLYVHYREPHFPYDPEPPFDTRFGPDGPIPKTARREMDFFRDVNQGRRPFTDAEREHLVRLYDGNLAYVDQELGALRSELERLGLWDRTVFILAADHGEALGEHGWIGHNAQVYEPSVRIPLIVRFPPRTGPRGTRVRALVDLLDLAPTIADIFGVLGKGGSDRAFQGRSLLPVLEGAPGKPLVVSRTIWERPRYALRDERWTYLYETATGNEQLFDTLQDPDERVDLASREPLRTTYYRETLHDWLRTASRSERAAQQPAAELSRDQCEDLKVLGYLDGGHVCPEETHAR